MMVGGIHLPLLVQQDQALLGVVTHSYQTGDSLVIYNPIFLFGKPLHIYMGKQQQGN